MIMGLCIAAYDIDCAKRKKDPTSRQPTRYKDEFNSTHAPL